MFFQNCYTSVGSITERIKNIRSYVKNIGFVLNHLLYTMLFLVFTYTIRAMLFITSLPSETSEILGKVFEINK